MNTCPRCQFSEMQVRAGRNRTGTQRFLCRACGHSYTPEPKSAGHDEAKREVALTSYICCASMRDAALYAQVSTQTVANWVWAAVAEAKQEREDGTLESGNILSRVLWESERREAEELRRMHRREQREHRREKRSRRRGRTAELLSLLQNVLEDAW